MLRSIAITLLAVSPGALLTPQLAFAQSTPEPLRIAGPPTEDATNLYYGIKSQIFAKAGVDVEMIDTTSGATATQAVIAGTYELARTNLLSVIQAHLHGIDLVLVAPSLMYDPHSPSILLQIATDASYRNGADLEGKTAGVPTLHTGAALMTKAWVDKNGGNWKSLKFVEVPNSAMEAALVQHRVDVGVLQPPQLDASLAGGTTKTLGDCMGAIAPNYLYGAYVARREWASQHQDVLVRFIRALGEATNYVSTHPAQTAPLVSELTKIDIAHVRQMHRSVNGTTLDVSIVQPFIDASARYEEISRAFPAHEIFWR